MKDRLIKTILFLIEPKSILLSFTIFLLFYVGYKEAKIQELAGCYDCGYETRQAFYLLVASAALLINRVWGAIISLLGSLKVVYSIGYWTFFNRLYEIEGNSQQIVKQSLRWTYELRPEFFIEIIIALIIGFFAISFLRQNIYPKYNY